MKEKNGKKSIFSMTNYETKKKYIKKSPQIENKTTNSSQKYKNCFFLYDSFEKCEVMELFDR